MSEPTADMLSRMTVNPHTGSTFNLPVSGKTSKPGLEKQTGAAVKIDNSRIQVEVEDVLYHFGLGNKSHDLREMFSDVKFVCMGGSAPRALAFAQKIRKGLGIKLPVGADLAPVGKTERYSLYKVGPVISVNHGMGMPSMSILLHEMTKLLFHAGAHDVTYIRIGTSGGLGLEAGTVVIAEAAVNEECEPFHKQLVLGKERSLSTELDLSLAKAAFAVANDAKTFGSVVKAVLGKTMGTNDFYEGQGRVDGAFCDYDEGMRDAWLKEIHAKGVVNIEMEGPMFAAFCRRAKIPCLLCNAVLLNRLESDQVGATPEQLKAISNNAQEIVMRLLKKALPALSA
eukprot:TRINITY_DN3723_c0_g1_i1.p1 TRINITY_DN3723_c0_g1~~TRINITY_DN3723_c0_g1_i1.p1  ORF type:complete len:366 (+),score=93.38 TRINITY_DN3723_c0_g1_i1:76-1098(+)